MFYIRLTTLVSCKQKFEQIARLVRKTSLAFGGIQLGEYTGTSRQSALPVEWLYYAVLTGDFFQLPPIQDFSPEAKGKKHRPVQLLFESHSWKRVVRKIFILSQ